MSEQQPDPDLAPSDRVKAPLAAVNVEPTTGVYRFVGRVLHQLVGLIARRVWLRLDRVPATGPVLVVANHLSYFDPEVLADALIWAGRWPRFLAKAQLWRVPFLGFLARQTGQIPVERDTAAAGDALVHAAEGLDQGRLVVIYPEGTLTREPELWPMSARPGAARLALHHQVPVIPVAQWGAQLVIPGHHAGFPRIWPRRTVTVLCGEPVDLDDLRPYLGTEREHEAELVATERIIDAITALLESLRGESAPELRWDTRQGRRVARGTATMS